MCLFGFCIEGGGRLVWVFFVFFFPPVFCIVSEGGKEEQKKKRKRLALKKCALLWWVWDGLVAFALDLLKKLAEIFFWVLMVNRFYSVLLFLGWSTD